MTEHTVHSALRHMLWHRARQFIYMLAAIAPAAGCNETPTAPKIIDGQFAAEATLLASELGQDESEYRPSFTLTNSASGAATIRLVTKDCSCFELMVNGTPLLQSQPVTVGPGKAFDVQMQFAISRDIGNVRRSALLSVDTQDSKDSQEVLLTNELSVIDDLKIDRPKIVHEFRHEREINKVYVVHVDQTIRSRARPVFGEIEIAAPLEHVSVDSAKPLGIKQTADNLWTKSWRLSVVLEKPTLEPPFTIQQELKIVAASPGITSRTMLITLNGFDGIRYPKVIDFGEVAVGEEVTRRCQIESADQTAFRIDKVTGTKNVNVELETTPISSSSKHWLNFTVNPLELGDVSDEVTIHTSHDKATSFHILTTYVGVSAGASEAVTSARN